MIFTMTIAVVIAESGRFLSTWTPKCLPMLLQSVVLHENDSHNVYSSSFAELECKQNTGITTAISHPC